MLAKVSAIEIPAASSVRIVDPQIGQVRNQSEIFLMSFQRLQSFGEADRGKNAPLRVEKSWRLCRDRNR